MKRTASEVIRNLEMRIARLERQSRSKVKVPDYDLKQAIDELDMMFGWDENEEEVDLDLRIRDWKFEDSSATAWGAPITFISIKSRKTRQTFYAVWVETRPGKFSRLYKFISVYLLPGISGSFGKPSGGEFLVLS